MANFEIRDGSREDNPAWCFAWEVVDGTSEAVVTRVSWQTGAQFGDKGDARAVAERVVNMLNDPWCAPAVTA